MATAQVQLFTEREQDTEDVQGNGYENTSGDPEPAYTPDNGFIAVKNRACDAKGEKALTLGHLAWREIELLRTI